MEQLFVTILAAIGIIFVLMIIYYFLARWMEYYQTRDRPTRQFPSPEYEKIVGAQCPDYFSMQGSLTGGTHQCVNKFNIPVYPSPSSMCMVTDEKTGKQVPFKCYDDGSNNTRTFKTITEWPVRNRRDIKERCLYRSCCGPAKGKPIPAAWVGIEQTCGY